ncbi:MAG: diphosphate--fructose-6-phosphate 1-phosphotransferase [Clostridia bacterium]|nr:diphosphate--fructose-6-phosphate 1-phosphotransferase [Clostridia bacterium]
MKNVIVGQSGGPTAVINASLLGVYRKAKELGANKVYGMVYGIQGLLEKRLVDLDEYLADSGNQELLKRTPSAFLGSCRYKLPEPALHHPTYEKIFAILRELDIDAFFYIGGNDSMDTISKLSTYSCMTYSDTLFVGIPKTVDNDLAITDHTPGYGSACKYIANTLKELVRDGLVYQNPVISVVEIMGRDAGWLTASACLVKDDDCEGVEMILLPELTVDIPHFLQKVGAIVKQGKSAVIAVSEGIKVADGRYVCQLADEGTQKDPFGHVRLAGTSRYLADLIAQTYGCRTKSMELSFMQRSASHCQSLTDVTEAESLGAYAVQLAYEDKSGIVATLVRTSNNPYNCKLDYSAVHHVANAVKKIPLSWIDGENYQVTQELVDYIRPLVEGHLEPIWDKGLAKHLILKK